MALNDQLKITTTCRGCHQPMHLVQDSSGSMWMHDKLIDEHNCWNTHRGACEPQTFEEHTAAAITKILGA